MIFQHRHRAVADKIVHPPQGLVDDSLGFVPRPPGGNQCFGHSTDEKRPPQIGIALVEQQIAVMLAVSRQKPVEQQLQNPLGLFGIVKRRIVFSQFGQFLCQRVLHPSPRLVGLRRRTCRSSAITR